MILDVDLRTAFVTEHSGQQFHEVSFLLKTTKKTKMNAKIDKMYTVNWYRLGTGTGAGTPVRVPVPAEIVVPGHL